MLLHGSGGDETSLLATGRAIAPGAALLSPRGKVIDQQAARFFARHFTSGQAQQEEIHQRGRELDNFLRAARKHYALDQPVVLAGFSSGANMALHLMLNTHTDWEGAILMRGSAVMTSGTADLKRRPVLVLCGIHDPLVQTDQAEELAEQLRAAEAEVTLHWEEAGHSLCQGDLLMAFDWLRRFYRSLH